MVGETDRIMYREVTGRTVLCLAAILLCVSVARADYEQGLKAWNAGRPAEALVEWRNAAEAEDRRAMLRLGRLYLQGLGALQDYVLAHMWFNLSASRGEAEALRERDALAAKMTPQQIASAQERARAWRPGRESGPPKSAAVPPSTARSPTMGPPPPHAIREAQGLMAALGYSPGTADGRWGPRTAKAYTAFLRDAGMPPGNVLTPEGLRAMRAAATQRNLAAPAASAVRPSANLHRLVASGDIDGLKTALAGGANANARDARGWPALTHAADKGYVLMVAPLLKAGADVNLRAPDGATALFVAALHGHSEIVAALMKAGADTRVKGPGGKTAADVARMKYGSVAAALQRNENTAVIGLLRGKTGRQMAEELRLLEKKEFRDCKECPEMVVVPSGSFMMGSRLSQLGREDHEGPAHRVTILEPYAIGKYEVTFAQWDACVAAGGCREHHPHDEGWGRGRLPVIDVSWWEARAYVRWLSRKTGKRYRLLSEAEWEYATRAGTTEAFYFGSTISTDQANYDGDYTYSSGRKGLDRGKTVPIGSFPPNAFGLHDVHGNVREWVEDCWHESYRGAPEDGGPWTTGDNCRMRVLRGGAWHNSPQRLRSASRIRNSAGNRSSNIGFRVARTLSP